MSSRQQGWALTKRGGTRTPARDDISAPPPVSTSLFPRLEQSSCRRRRLAPTTTTERPHVRRGRRGRRRPLLKGLRPRESVRLASSVSSLGATTRRRVTLPSATVQPAAVDMMMMLLSRRAHSGSIRGKQTSDGGLLGVASGGWLAGCHCRLAWPVEWRASWIAAPPRRTQAGAHSIYCRGPRARPRPGGVAPYIYRPALADCENAHAMPPPKHRPNAPCRRILSGL